MREKLVLVVLVISLVVAPGWPLAFMNWAHVPLHVAQDKENGK